MKILIASIAALVAITPRFFTADKGGETGASTPGPKVNPEPRPKAIVGSPEARKRGQERGVNQEHARRLAELNRDRNANGLPSVDEVPGFYVENEEPRELEPTNLVTGFHAQGPTRPVGTGGEFGTSNERASVGRVPVGSSDVAVANIERSIAQDQPIDGGRGTVPSGELQAHAPIVDPITNQDVVTGAQLPAPGDTGGTGTGNTGASSVGTTATGGSTAGSTSAQKGPKDETVEDLVAANDKEHLQSLAEIEGVATSGTKEEIATRIVEARQAK